jgi:quercetin dioxygenase-like cupin family protein
MSYDVRSASAAEANAIDASWGSLTWLASQALGNADGVTVGRVIIKPGEANPKHSHHNGEEVLYLLRGRLKHWIGDEYVMLEAGDTLSIPEDVPHYAVNVGDEDADMIVAYSTGDRDFNLEE